MKDEFLWVEKYRPKTIEECILPESIKKTFLDFLDKGEVPNLLLAQGGETSGARGAAYAAWLEVKDAKWFEE